MEFINVQGQYLHLREEIDRAVLGVMESGHFIMGPDVELFEQEFADYIGVRNVIGCGNGTDALMLLYMAYGVGPGDAVFVPDLTFIATHEPACLLGAEPVFVDIDPISYNISPAALDAQIQRVKAEGRLRPRCITAVDFLGNPCEWDQLREIAERHDLILFEDAAQATGALFHGHRCGSFGCAAATSFFPTKPLGCFGDGGAVLTNDDDVAQVMRSLQVHGRGTSKYDNIRIGLNTRLDTLQAALLRVKLRHLEDELTKRQKIAARYTEALKDCFITPVIDPQNRSSFAQYVLIMPDGLQRELVMRAMDANGLPHLIYYPAAMHQLPVFCDNPSAVHCKYPEAERYAAQSLCLPFSPYLDSSDQERVIETLLSI